MQRKGVDLLPQVSAIFITRHISISVYTHSLKLYGRLPIAFTKTFAEFHVLYNSKNKYDEVGVLLSVHTRRKSCQEVQELNDLFL